MTIITFKVIVCILCTFICYIIADLVCDTYIITEHIVWMIAGMASISLGNIILIISDYMCGN